MKTNNCFEVSLIFFTWQNIIILVTFVYTCVILYGLCVVWSCMRFRNLRPRLYPPFTAKPSHTAVFSVVTQRRNVGLFFHVTLLIRQIVYPSCDSNRLFISLYTHLYPEYSCIPCIPMYTLYTHVYPVCIPCIPMYILYTPVYLV